MTAVVGSGYWCTYLVRPFAETRVAKLVAVCDPRADKLWAVALRSTGSPVRTHFDPAMKALGASKHVFLEKPIAETAAQARALVKEADRGGLVLMVDYTFIYTGAVKRSANWWTKANSANCSITAPRLLAPAEDEHQ
jgi:predicted dehydrogenase